MAVGVEPARNGQGDEAAYERHAARALAAGLSGAGERRLVSVGLASVLSTAAGAPLMDTPDYPQEWRAFYVGHGAGTEALRAAAPEGLHLMRSLGPGWSGSCQDAHGGEGTGWAGKFWE